MLAHLVALVDACSERLLTGEIVTNSPIYVKDPIHLNLATLVGPRDRGAELVLAARLLNYELLLLLIRFFKVIKICSSHSRNLILLSFPHHLVKWVDLLLRHVLGVRQHVADA